LAAQLDASISLGLSPLQTDLAASLDGAIALQASLSLSAADPLASIRAALSAIIELQASLSAALILPPLQAPELNISAAASLSAALTARLGGLQLLIDGILSVKLPAVQGAGALAAALAAGPAVIFSFDGLNVLGAGGSMTLQEAGDLVQSEFSGTIGHPTNPALQIQPADDVSGIIIVTKVAAVFDALGSIILTS
jgi:hypothetical protein